jgi:hypothetical protein
MMQCKSARSIIIASASSIFVVLALLDTSSDDPWMGKSTKKLFQFGGALQVFSKATRCLQSKRYDICLVSTGNRHSWACL